ncbi:MAG TPA: transcriptional repressor [Aquificaceae bacterium]|nr:transcriptional repressor [Aquificaceae bacterium]HIQ49122.1 transcriptional repressor [Aquifex aeolicus]
MQNTHEKLELFVKKCKEIGLKITPQRLAVYEVLLKSYNHPTVEEIYEEVKKMYPYVSLATVYRTLETLEKIGLVKRVCFWGNSARYDANTSEHHHLICEKCGRIEDIDLEQKLAIPENLQGFKTHSYSVNIYGLCSECQSNQQA